MFLNIVDELTSFDETSNPFYIRKNFHDDTKQATFFGWY